ncbi:MAG: MBL fold metallo-hydrolase [Candidatus Omnitrophica bacterium]|nr:MBL fold metallo-hydrolase [Candidatus Omnitrophota bacterium]
MKISWLGHAAFLLETKRGTKIITDPYESGSYSGAVGYAPIGMEPDIVTVSHYHFDHGYTKDFSSAKVLDKEGVFSLADVEIEGVLSYHDKEKGAQRGKNIIFIIKAEDLKIIHFGDLGTLEVDYTKLESPDVVLVPVGGIFTIDAKEATQLIERLKPKITIPMHFKTPKLGFDIGGVEEFLEGKENVERGLDFIEVSKDTLTHPPKVVVLNFLR